jgi:hypothetical protein
LEDNHQLPSATVARVLPAVTVLDISATDSSALTESDAVECGSVSNVVQATICVNLLKHLSDLFGPAGASLRVVVLAPYAAQVTLIERKLAAVSPPIQYNLNFLVTTVDSFQGKEADVVIFSTVRCNLAGEIGFCADPRRLNVATTRARSALIVVAHVATFSRPECGDWKAFFDHCEAQFHSSFIKVTDNPDSAGVVAPAPLANHSATPSSANMPPEFLQLVDALRGEFDKVVKSGKEYCKNKGYELRLLDEDDGVRPLASAGAKKCLEGAATRVATGAEGRQSGIASRVSFADQLTKYSALDRKAAETSVGHNSSSKAIVSLRAAPTGAPSLAADHAAPSLSAVRSTPPPGAVLSDPSGATDTLVDAPRSGDSDRLADSAVGYHKDAELLEPAVGDGAGKRARGEQGAEGRVEPAKRQKVAASAVASGSSDQRDMTSSRCSFQELQRNGLLGDTTDAASVRHSGGSNAVDAVRAMCQFQMQIFQSFLATRPLDRWNKLVVMSASYALLHLYVREYGVVEVHPVALVVACIYLAGKVSVASGQCSDAAWARTPPGAHCAM